MVTHSVRGNDRQQAAGATNSSTVEVLLKWCTHARLHTSKLLLNSAETSNRQIVSNRSAYVHASSQTVAARTGRIHRLIVAKSVISGCRKPGEYHGNR
jgi:hypothetical protein